MCVSVSNLLQALLWSLPVSWRSRRETRPQKLCQPDSNWVRPAERRVQTAHRGEQQVSRTRAGGEGGTGRPPTWRPLRGECIYSSGCEWNKECIYMWTHGLQFNLTQQSKFTYILSICMWYIIREFNIIVLLCVCVCWRMWECVRNVFEFQLERLWRAMVSIKVRIWDEMCCLNCS